MTLIMVLIRRPFSPKGCPKVGRKIFARPLSAASDGLPPSSALGDNLDVTAVVDEIPLAKDAEGVYRVGGRRVTLDLVVRAFNRGATAEEIVQKYDSLRLPDVYQVIGYCLKHADELADYFENRAREERTLLSSHPEWSPKGLRDRLLARRNLQ